MEILGYFFEHYIMLTEVIGLWALIRLGVHLPKKTTDATRVTILLIVLESIAWSLEEWTQFHDGHVLLRFFLSASVYCFHPFIALSVIQLVAPLGKRFKYLLLPLVVYAAVIFTSQWTHVVYFISEDNVWFGSGNIWRWLPYITFVVYVMIFVVLFIARYIKYRITTILGVVYIVAVSLLGILVNVIENANTDYATLFASVIVLYYLFLYTHMSKTDTLTGLLNRQSFYRDTKAINNKLTAVCSADLNELKWINDSQGHEAGDLAIQIVADCLAKGHGHSKSVYRVGGDDFVILYYDKDEEKVQADIAAMREELAKTKYVCAFGYCMRKGKEDFEDCLRESDKAMYANKASIKKAILESGGKLHRRAGD